MSRLTDALKSEKIIFGEERILKLLKLGKVKTVFLSSNVKKDVEDEIENLAKLSKVEIVKLTIPNNEVGVVCKKPFSISILGY